MCQAPPLKKRSIRVSSSVALAGLSHTITEQSVSSDSPGQTPPGLVGWALIKRRLPTVKEQQQQPTTSESPSISLHLPAVTLPRRSPLLSLCVFLPWKCLTRVCKHGRVSWENSLSLAQTAVDTFPSRRPVDRQRCQAQSGFMAVVPPCFLF